MEARVRLSELWLGRLQRGPDPLRARPGIAHPSTDESELRSLDGDLSMGKRLWLRLSLRGAALYSSVFARLDRLSRNPGYLHARKGLRLLREQPARNLRSARVRDSQPARLCRLCRR